VRSFTPGWKVWLHLLWSSKVGAVACAAYDPHKHGTPGKNNTDNFHLITLDSELEKNKYFPELGKIFAVSLLVSKNRFGAGVYGEGEDTFHDEPWMHTLPLAILGMDFDCPRSDANAKFISERMGKIPGDWSLLDTGGSYHWLAHGLVPPKYLPFHYGQILKLFAEETDEISAEFFNRAGSCLEKGWNNRKLIEWVIGSIDTNVRHWDEPNKKKAYTYPDVRWMGHTLEELVRFLYKPTEVKKSGFGYLRVGPKIPGGLIPTLKAEKKGEEIVVYELAGSTL
jgi:hypothetical protein